MSWRLGLVIGWIILCGANLLADEPSVSCGFAHRDITPEVGPDHDPVWVAGYGFGRRATGVHDPLFVRCVVMKTGDDLVAIAAVDLVGLQLDIVQQIRQELREFKHVTVCSTHNHEGPDVIGIWGRTPFKRGVNDAYLAKVIEQTVAAIREAAQRVAPMSIHFGSASDGSLLADRRLPEVKDDTLRVLRFNQAGRDQPAGLLVQWSCHPETLGPENTLLTADFPAATVKWLSEKYGCPVVYLSGAVGGLMAPPLDSIRDAEGKVLTEGDFEFARVYGEAVAKLAEKAVASAEPLRVDAPRIAQQEVALLVENKLYRLARKFGVLKREARAWLGDSFTWGEVVEVHEAGEPVAVMSEVSYLQLGELHICNIPGELYPELVYGQGQDPVDPHADFADAEREPCVASLLPDRKWILIGLASDEIGYIIPRRQWDEKPPYAYDRKQPQYGEINSCGPLTAPTIMEALRRCIAKASQTELAETK